jgi:hypothetical protein
MFDKSFAGICQFVWFFLGIWGTKTNQDSRVGRISKHVEQTSDEAMQHGHHHHGGIEGWLRHKQSNLFVHPQGGIGRPDVPLLLHPGGYGEHRLKFRWHLNGDLEHIESGLYVHPQGGHGKENALLLLCPGGGEDRLKWQLMGNCLQHTQSGLYVHPQGGIGKENVHLLLCPGGGEGRLEFELVA